MLSKYERRAFIGTILFCGAFWSTVIYYVIQ